MILRYILVCGNMRNINSLTWQPHLKYIRIIIVLKYAQNLYNQLRSYSRYASANAKTVVEGIFYCCSAAIANLQKLWFLEGKSISGSFNCRYLMSARFIDHSLSEQNICTSLVSPKKDDVHVQNTFIMFKKYAGAWTDVQEMTSIPYLSLRRNALSGIKWCESKMQIPFLKIGYITSVLFYDFFLFQLKVFCQWKVNRRRKVFAA